MDVVTPCNAHIRAAYHWLKDILRDGYIDLRGIASPLNLADFLTKVVMGPAMRSSSDAVSGYTSPPAIPPALKFLTRITLYLRYTTITVFRDFCLTALVGGCVAKTPLREYPDNLKITKTLVQLVRLSSVFFE